LQLTRPAGRRLSPRRQFGLLFFRRSREGGNPGGSGASGCPPARAWRSL